MCISIFLTKVNLFISRLSTQKTPDVDVMKEKENHGQKVSLSYKSTAQNNFVEIPIEKNFQDIPSGQRW